MNPTKRARIATPSHLTAHLVSTSPREAMYTVRRNGELIGLITKIKDTRTERHPWKAMLCDHTPGEMNTFLGFVWNAKFTHADDLTPIGSPVENVISATPTIAAMNMVEAAFDGATS